jgi:hypothetical protein
MSARSDNSFKVWTCSTLRPPHRPIQDLVSLRNGIYCFKTEEQVLAQRKWTDEVTLGQHATWTFNDATVAMNESDTTLQFSVLPSQESDAEDSQSASCSVAIKGTRQRLLRSGQKSLVLPGPTKRATKHTSWKCNKTHVATPVDNRKFPNLPKTRTGWCMGRLVAFDPARDHPYEIEWECVESTMKSHVNAKEMAILVEHYKGCKKRLLVEWFAVGLELLVITPRKSKVPEMKWGYVMFYENETKLYKMLYRDGTDDWVIGKVLDDIIKLNEFYNLEQKVKASAQEWDSQVHTTIESCGT